MSEPSNEGHQDALTLVVPLFDEAARFPVHAHELLAFIAGQPPGSEVIFVDDHLFGWLVPAVAAGWTPASTQRRLASPWVATLVDRVALVLTRIEVSIIRRRPLRFGTSIVCVASSPPSRTQPDQRRSIAEGVQDRGRWSIFHSSA